MASSYVTPPKSYRATESVDLWSSRVSGKFTFDELEHALVELAINDQRSYTGFVSKPESNRDTSFTCTRYPRKKYGIIPITDCELGMAKLAGRLNGLIQPEEQQCGFRTVLGLTEGYDSQAPEHTLIEIVTKLGKAAVIEPAKVLAVRFTNVRVSTYTEPVAVIRGTNDSLPLVYELADDFKQQRFTVEDFDVGRAWAVETRYCTEPD